jgi:D-alanyl-D-alanine carboxypeptidase
MRKFAAFFIALILFASASEAQEISCGPKSSLILLRAKNRQIIEEVRADNLIYPASLTKLMTLYLAFEAIEKGKISSDKVITISERGEEVSKVNKVLTLHLKEGDKITVREAIRGVIVKSFNEAAVSLAEAVAGDEWHFVRKMNEAARKLHMNNTAFRNASGLHEEGQYSTVYDLARLTLALKEKFPGYYHLFSLKNFEFADSEYETHNNFVKNYRRAEGLKTGFTKAAGYNLIAAAYDKNSSERIFSIVVGCPSATSRDQVTEKLIEKNYTKNFSTENSSIALKLKL